MGKKSVLITEHRYTREYNQSETSGIYCVQFMTFKNDKNGMKALNWWRDSCNEWCYARFEEGKFGDQKYLDDWLDRFEGIHSLKNLGGGVAPWNVQQYDLCKKEFKLIFYHFHGFKFIGGNKLEFGNYKLRKCDLKILYKPYLLHLEDIKNRIEQMGDTYDFHGTKEPERNWKTPLRNIKRQLKNIYNTYDKHYILGL